MVVKRQADMGFRESPDKPWTMGDGRLVHDEGSLAAAEKPAVLLNKCKPQKVVLQCTVQLAPKNLQVLLGSYADHATLDQIDDALRVLANSIFKGVPVSNDQSVSIGWREAEESDYE